MTSATPRLRSPLTDSDVSRHVDDGYSAAMYIGLGTLLVIIILVLLLT
jgi:hypothetical protein